MMNDWTQNNIDEEFVSFTNLFFSFSISSNGTQDGVHVGQSDMSAAEVRKLIGPNLILGVSTKSCAEVSW